MNNDLDSSIRDDYYSEDSKNYNNVSYEEKKDNNGLWWKILLGILVVLIIILLLLKFCAGNKAPKEKTSDEKYAELKAKICDAAESYINANSILIDKTKAGSITYVEYQKLVDLNLIEKNIENPYYADGNSEEKYYALTRAAQLTVKSDSTLSCELVDKVADVIAPVIKLNGKSEFKLVVGTPFEDPKATALDNVDGELTDKIVIEGEANYKEPGTYTITYAVTDSAGNTATLERKVIYLPTNELPDGTVIDNETPKIILNGDNPMCMVVNTEYKEPGAYATDNIDGNITSKILVTTVVSGDTIGTFGITYTVKDSSDNETTAYRAVKVAKECPVIEENPTKKAN